MKSERPVVRSGAPPRSRAQPDPPGPESSRAPLLPVTPPAAARRVTEADIGRIPAIQDLLMVLNDSCAGAAALCRHVERIPVLAARLRFRFAERFARSSTATLAEQLSVLGNRELEAVLLELLEELVELHCDIKDRQASRRR